MQQFFKIKDRVYYTHHDESDIKERGVFLKLKSDSLGMKLTLAIV